MEILKENELSDEECVPEPPQRSSNEEQDSTCPNRPTYNNANNLNPDIFRDSKNFSHNFSLNYL